MSIRSLTIGLFLLLSSFIVSAEPIKVAVASNFTPTLRLLAESFKEQTGHSLRISSASTGKLYAQITHGAPFDILLAADAERPQLLEQDGLIVPGSRFTYALGKLALWGPSVVWHGPATELLTSDQISHIAMANPHTAPYGKAAQESLEKLGLWERLQDRLIRGENVGQSFQYVASGAAPIGFVAYSQVLADRPDKAYLWQVPTDHYTSIRQQAVLLKRAQNNQAARAFMDFLISPDARHTIIEQGYEME